MRIVTSGSSYIDIDAYAGIIAYAELLNTMGQQAMAVSTAPWNESITQTIRSFAASLATEYNADPTDTFTLIDVSDPDYFDRITETTKIDVIVDHHPGFEAYWDQRLGKNAHIEFIGAACTLVYEHWIAAGMLRKMTASSANLLVSGILDNTLNFKAHVTTDRDKAAFNALMVHGRIPSSWVATYFNECQESIVSNIETAVSNDSKTLNFKTNLDSISVGQLVVWSAEEVLDKYYLTIEKLLGEMNPKWFMNVVSVHEGFSYFVAKDLTIKKWLSVLLGVTFDGDVARSDRLWLRKEIIQEDIKASQFEASI